MCGGNFMEYALCMSVRPKHYSFVALVVATLTFEFYYIFFSTFHSLSSVQRLTLPFRICVCANVCVQVVSYDSLASYYRLLLGIWFFDLNRIRFPETSTIEIRKMNNNNNIAHAHILLVSVLNARHKSTAFLEKQQKEEKMFIENRSIMNPNGTSRIHPTDCSHTCAMHCITSAIIIIIIYTMHSIHTYIHCPWSLVNYEWWKMVCSKHARNRLLRIHSMRCGAHAHCAYTHTNTHI